MSYPAHPKSAQIKRMLMEMKLYKQIQSELRVPLAAIKWHVSDMGMLRILVTRQERLWLAERRGINPKLVP